MSTSLWEGARVLRAEVMSCSDGDGEGGVFFFRNLSIVFLKKVMHFFIIWFVSYQRGFRVSSLRILN